MGDNARMEAMPTLGDYLSREFLGTIKKGNHSPTTLPQKGSLSMSSSPSVRLATQSSWWWECLSKQPYVRSDSQRPKKSSLVPYGSSSQSPKHLESTVMFRRSFLVLRTTLDSLEKPSVQLTSVSESDLTKALWCVLNSVPKEESDISRSSHTHHTHLRLTITSGEEAQRQISEKTCFPAQGLLVLADWRPHQVVAASLPPPPPPSQFPAEHGAVVRVSRELASCFCFRTVRLLFPFHVPKLLLRMPGEKPITSSLSAPSTTHCFQSVLSANPNRFLRPFL